MENRRRVRNWLSLILPLFLAVFLLAACNADEEGGGGGLGDETPVVDDGLDGVDDGIDDGIDDGVDDGLDDGVDDGLAETPVVEPTVAVDAEPTLEEEEPIVEATEEPADVAEPTAEMTATVETGDQETPPTGAEGQGMVSLASNLIGMNIQDDAGADVAVIDELLADDTGAIQYVIVDALAIDATLDDDTATDDDIVDDTTDDAVDDTADDAVTDDAAQDDVVGNTFALPWSAIEVQSGVTPETEPDVDVEDDQLFHLVYAGDMAIEEQPSFDASILDEAGAVLDDQNVDTEGTAIPAEFSNLIQVSAYDEVDFANTAGEEIGELEDALIDLQEGVVRYIIADVGGFLGIGERTVAIPFEAFQIDVTVDGDTEQELVTLDVDQTTLENAPEFDDDAWTPDVDTDWDTEWHQFWESEIDMDLNTEADS